MSLPATEAELEAWLDQWKLRHLARGFIVDGWVGERLADLTTADLDALEVPRRPAESVLRDIAERGGFEAATSSVDALGRSRRLAEWLSVQNWVGTVLKTWPGPIAHELQSLLEQLRLGRVPGALWQLKDFAEILCKIPATVMLVDYLAHGAGEPAFDHKRKLRAALFAKEPSYGDWEKLARERLPPLIAATPHSTLPELAALFRQTRGKATRFADWLQASVGWRNSVIGHGGFNPDDNEVLDSLKRQLVNLCDAMPEAVAAAPWADAAISIGDVTPIPLIGWHSIRAHHDSGQPQPHTVAILPLVLERRGRPSLTLAPYLAARRCDVCSRRDVFLFNDRKRGTSRFTFIDYATSHTSVAHPWMDLAIADEANQGDEISPPTVPESVAGGAMSGSMERLLEETAVGAAYLSPTYLREPLRAFVEAHARGVYWLRAPADVGKTQFVRGLVEAHRGSGTSGLRRDKPLLERGLVSIGFHIRREQVPKPAMMAVLLHESFCHTLDLGSADRNASSYGAVPGEVSAARVWFCGWLGTLMRIARARVQAARLLVCLDGLDELPPSNPATQAAGIHSLLPTADEMPEDVILLLTSRPQAECQPLLWQEITSRLGNAVTAVTVGLSNDRYRALLSDYFWTQTKGLLRVQAIAALREWTGESVAKAEVASFLSQHPALNDVVRSAWEELRRADKDLPRELPSVALTPVLARFEQAEAELVDRADARFRFVSFLVARLSDHSLALRELSALPKGEQLLESFNLYLQRRLPPKLHDWAERLVLLLAAAEEADAWERREYPANLLEPEFRGLSLDILRELLGDPGEAGESDNVPSPTFLFALYAIRSILGSWRGKADAEAANYQLGLKGMAETVRKLWPDRLDDTHRNLATDCEAWRQQEFSGVMKLSEPATLSGAERYRLPSLLAHAECAGDAALAHKIAAAGDLVDAWLWMGKSATRSQHKAMHLSIAIGLLSRRGETESIYRLCTARIDRANKLSDLLELTAAIADYSYAIERMQALHEILGDDWHPNWTNELARAYTCRGIAKLNAPGQGAKAAIADYDRAIELREAMRTAFGDGWPSTFADDLAGSYTFRGNAKRDAPGQGALSATADYNRAIELREAVRKLGDNWPPLWANELARVYMERGIVAQYQGATTGAIADLSRAIELREELRTTLGMRYTTEWASDLAASYMNRGVAKLYASGWGHKASILDYDRAIEIQEDIRAAMGRNWLYLNANDLASLYMNRGSSKRLASGYGAGEALADHDRAIALGEALQTALGTNLPPPWAQTLAVFYMNRGNAKKDVPGKGAIMAIDDYDRAIEMQETLRAALGDDWLPPWAFELAAAYINRGLVKQSSPGYGADAAIEDYGRAITLHETLRATQSDNLRPRWINDLATAYLNRGVARQYTSGHDIMAAITDYDRAIVLWEALRTAQHKDWPSHWANNLATAYMNRGNSKQQQVLNHGAGAAIKDYDRAIKVWEVLNRDLGENFPPQWAEHLQQVQRFRAIVTDGSQPERSKSKDIRQKLSVAADFACASWCLPTPIPGNWQDLSEEQAKLLADRLSQTIQASGSFAEQTELLVEAIRVLPTRFYDGWMLCDIQVRLGNASPPEPRSGTGEAPPPVLRAILCYLCGPDGFLPLAGASASIHAHNQQHGIDLSTEECRRDYLKFYCFAVQGDGKPFLIKESKEALDLSEARPAKDVTDNIDFALQALNGPEFGRRLYATQILYGGAIFRVELALEEDGRVSMLQDKLTMENVSERSATSYIGHVRFPGQLPNVPGLKYQLVPAKG